MISPIFDWWIIPHLGFFIFVGSTIGVRCPKISYKWHVVWILALALGWEIAEYFLQRAYTEAWSGFIEHWANAWLVDPITDLVGGLVGVAIGKWSKGRGIAR